MENVKIALVCGLCAGCKHAINLAKEANKTENVTLFKEIVHNKNINNALKISGISCAENLEDIKQNSTVIIRAHGEPPQTFEYLIANNIMFLDGTCINVKSIHGEVTYHSKLGETIVIIGKYGKTTGQIHPEVFGTIGYCTTKPILIEDIEDVKKLTNITNQKIFVICQTTFNPNKFKKIKNEITAICNKNNNELQIKNTICGAQMAIQKSSIALANNSDLMIVVGGKNSSNTLELFKNVSLVCPAIHIENINDWQNEIQKINFEITNTTKIGLTAGASTDRQELIDLKLKIENYINSL